MRDVASLAGVSVATVSRVINNESSVSSHTRRDVQRAIRELNYTSKSAAGGRATDHRRVGVIIPDVTNPYFSCLLEGMSRPAQVHDVELVLGNVSEDLETEQYFFEEMLENEINGFIYIPFAVETNPLVSDLVAESFPLVFLDREIEFERGCYVTSNNEEGAYQATTYLLSLGHRDILFISGPPHLSTSVTRQKGYWRGLASYGLQPKEELIVHGDDTSRESGYRVTEQLAQHGELPFTAIFASNDLMAFGAWEALEACGYRVPDDVSIAGYDDIPFADYVSLTTIAQPALEIGRNSFMLLMDLIEGRRQPPQRIMLRDSLVIRRSCRQIGEAGSSSRPPFFHPVAERPRP
jgi:LacI family transcriptional regulator